MAITLSPRIIILFRCLVPKLQSNTAESRFIVASLLVYLHEFFLGLAYISVTYHIAWLPLLWPTCGVSFDEYISYSSFSSFFFMYKMVHSGSIIIYFLSTSFLTIVWWRFLCNSPNILCVSTIELIHCCPWVGIKYQQTPFGVPPAQISSHPLPYSFVAIFYYIWAPSKTSV